MQIFSFGRPQAPATLVLSRAVKVCITGLALTAGLSACASGTGGPGRGGDMTSRLPPATVMDLKTQPPAEVRRRLGAPSLTRKEPPAEVWQFSSASCVIDIVFYPNDKGTLSADWLESRTLDGQGIDQNACLRTIGR